MSEMVERVANIILTTIIPERGSREDQCRVLARAAIEEMLVPTDAMRAAVENDAVVQGGLDDCNQHDIPDEVWRLMINAALGIK
jgi:hypothetical protein